MRLSSDLYWRGCNLTGLKSAGARRPMTNCTLLRQTSATVDCVHGKTFDCDPNNGTMWVAGCRGRFQCMTQTVKCGTPYANRKRHHCSCRNALPSSVCAGSSADLVSAVPAAISKVARAAEAHEVPSISALRQVACGVTANAEQALLAAGKSLQEVSDYFSMMGHIGTEDEQLVAYSRAVLERWRVRAVCEVGFNAGHSAALFLALTSPQNATYLAFDLFNQGYSSRALEFISKLFPGRVRTFAGLSQKTIPKHRQMLQHCDVWSLDGSHDEGAIVDLRNAFAASASLATPVRSPLVLMDDVLKNDRHVPSQVSEDRTPVQTVTRLRKGSHKVDGKCIISMSLTWENAQAAVKNASGLLTRDSCVFNGPKRGTPAWCGAWCMGTLSLHLDKHDEY